MVTGLPFRLSEESLETTLCLLKKDGVGKGELRHGQIMKTVESYLTVFLRKCGGSFILSIHR